MANGIRGITIEIGGDTRGLDSALRDVNQQSRDLQNELKQVERALRLDPGNIELVRQRQELLTESIQATSERLGVLRTAQAQVQAQFDRGDIGAEQYRAFQRELQSTEGELNRLQGQLNSLGTEQERLAQTTRQLGTFFAVTGTDVEQFAGTLGTRLTQAIRDGSASADQMERALRLMGRQALGASVDIDEMRAALRNVDNGSSLTDVRADLEAIRPAAAQAEQSVDGLKSSLKGIGTSVGVGSAAGVASMFALTEATEETNKAMARLRVGASESGNNFSTAEEAVKRLSSVTGDTRAAVEAVNNLMASGFKDADLLTMIENTTGAYIKFSDTLSAEGISDGIQETIALKEAAGSYLELLERHGVNIDDFNAKLQATGSSTEASKFAMEQFTKLGLAPMAEEYKKLNPELAANEAATANLEQSMSKLSKAIMPIVTAIKEVVSRLIEWALKNEGLALTIGAVLVAVSGVVAAFALLMPAIGAVVSILPAVASAGGIVTAAMSALGAVFAPLGAVIAAIASPIGLAIAAIVAIGAALVVAYNKVEWFRDGVNEVWNTIKEYTSTAFNAVKEVISTVLKSAIDLGKSIIADFKEFWATNGEAIVSLVKNQFEVIKTVIQGAMKVIQGIFQVAWPIISNAVKISFEVIKGAIKTGMDLAKGVITTAMKVINGDWKGAWESIKKTVSDIAENIVSTLKAINLVQVGKDIINGLIKGIKTMTAGVIEAITGVVDGVVNTAKKLLDINSPSRVMAEVGKWTGEGLAVGIDGTKSRVQQSIEDLGGLIIDVAQHHLDEEKKIIEASKEEIAKIEKRSAEDIDKIYRNAYSKKRKTTQDEDTKILRIKEDTAKKIADIEQKSTKQSVELISKNQKAMLEEIKLFITDKQSLEEMNLVQEAAVWEKSIALFDNGTKERVEAQKAYRNAVESINSQIVSINNEFQSKIKTISDNLVKQEEEATKAYVDAVENRKNALMSFSGTFDAFKAEMETTGLELMNNLQSQVDGFKLWQDEFTKISSRGINEDLLSELSELGVKALPQLMALNQLTDEQLTQYSALYQEKSQLAREQAEKELLGMKTDTQIKIEEMRKVANAELAKLHSDWNTKIKAVTQSTKTELSTLKQIGVDAGNGLLEGLASTADALYAKAKEIADNIANTISSALDIHSPSRVTMGFGVNINEGLIKGMEQSSGRLQRAMNNVYGSLASSAEKSVSVQSTSSQTPSSSTTTNTTEQIFHFTISSPKPLDPYETARLSRNALKEAGLQL